VVKDKETGGRIAIAFQVGLDKVPEDLRTKCLIEFFNNWLSSIPEAAPVNPKDSLPITWGALKR